MGVYIIVEQMGKVDMENQTKIIIPFKWLSMTLN